MSKKNPAYMTQKELDLSKRAKELRAKKALDDEKTWMSRVEFEQDEDEDGPVDPEFSIPSPVYSI